ncbi:hypothetical protein COCNU_contig68746810G000010 [Cocos nucifera]|nr:hypothetical protein [Cocos nucifera]
MVLYRQLVQLRRNPELTTKQSKSKIGIYVTNQNTNLEMEIIQHQVLPLGPKRRKESPPETAEKLTEEKGKETEESKEREGNRERDK